MTSLCNVQKNVFEFKSQKKNVQCVPGVLRETGPPPISIDPIVFVMEAMSFDSFVASVIEVLFYNGTMNCFCQMESFVNLRCQKLKKHVY